MDENYLKDITGKKTKINRPDYKITFNYDENNNSSEELEVNGIKSNGPIEVKYDTK